jgi:glycosyltransferase involved in cell wall biosynthesis
MNRPTVMELTHGLTIGSPGVSTDRFVFELVHALDRSRVEPLLGGLYSLDPSAEQPLIDKLREEGIRAVLGGRWDARYPYQSFFRAGRGLLRQLRGSRVDLIHSHFEFADGIALLIAAPLRCRALVRTVHHHGEWRRRRVRRLLLTNFLLPLCFRAEIGVSRQVADELSSRPLSRLLGKKGRCIYNARDLSRFAARPVPGLRDRKRRELGLPPDALVVGAVGRLTRQKGYPLLIDAAAAVVKELSDVHFIIVGEGDQAELSVQAARLGIEHSVHLAGARNDVPELLSAMDLLASSSLWEGLPTVILEAMTARVPVVATDVSGTRELVEDGVTGLLVPSGDAEALAQAIIRVLQDPGMTVEWVERAAERVRGISIEEVARQYVDLYEELL